MTFSDKLKKLRKKKGFTQDDLGGALKIHGRLICRYETGKTIPTIEILKKIANYFDVSIDYLVYDNAEDKQNVTVKDAQSIAQLKKFDKLDDEDKKAINKILDGLIFKKNVHDLSSHNT
jgi:transcriptional regulator with XRE-family HTH domain